MTIFKHTESDLSLACFFLIFFFSFKWKILRGLFTENTIHCSPYFHKHNIFVTLKESVIKGNCLGKYSDNTILQKHNVNNLKAAITSSSSGGWSFFLGSLLRLRHTTAAVPFTGSSSSKAEHMCQNHRHTQRGHRQMLRGQRIRCALTNTLN